MDRSPYSPDAVEEVADDRLPAYISNGVIGIRVPNVPWWGGFAVLNGLSGVHPSAAIECVPQVPYPLAGDIRLNGVLLSRRRTSGSDRAALRLRLRRTDQPLPVPRPGRHRPPDRGHAGQSHPADGGAPGDERRARPPSPGRAPRHPVSGGAARNDRSTRTAGARRRRGNRRRNDALVPVRRSVHGWDRLRQRVLRRRRGRAQLRRASESAPCTPPTRSRLAPAAATGFRQYASLVPKRVHNDPDRQATRLLALAVRQGFESLRHANTDAWRELWKSRIVLLGADERWQRLADAAFFYLNTSVHSSSLSVHEHLRPRPMGRLPLLLRPRHVGHRELRVPGGAPQASPMRRALLDFRTRSYGQLARCQRPPQWGYRGAHSSPGRAGPLHGEEAAPQLGDTAMLRASRVGWVSPTPSPGTQTATGDERFRREQAWPVVSEGRRVDREPGQDRPSGEYEIRTGDGHRRTQWSPDDNVGYVNMSAAVLLDEAAITIARRLGHPAPESVGPLRRGPRAAHRRG